MYALRGRKSVKQGGTAEKSVPANIAGAFFIRQNEEGGTKMAENNIPYKIYLEESEMPKEWYNVRADMKT